VIQLTGEFLKSTIAEIESESERTRRALAKRRHDIYRDGAEKFLIESIRREFSESAVKEMRLVPLNLLKIIVQKIARVYSRPPTRKATNPSDQQLVDYYVNDLRMNELMQKANRYYVLASNTALYVRPKINPMDPESNKLAFNVVPSYLYSVIPNHIDRTEIDSYIFSAFVAEGMIAPDEGLTPATGRQGYSASPGYKTDRDIVDSREKSMSQNAEQYLFWTKDWHVTTDSTGSPLMDTSQGEEQFINPIGRLPVVGLQKDRDNEAWATDNEGTVSICMTIASAWSDLVTIAKHAGFNICSIISEEEPTKLTIGVNRGIHLKPTQTAPNPSISFVSQNPPLAEYEGIVTTLAKLVLMTSNVEPGSVNASQAQSFTSGFHQLLAMSDALEAIKADQPVMRRAEEDVWDVVKKFHNWMFDSNLLNSKSRKLGRFTDDFSVSIQYAEIKPIESEQDRLARVKQLFELGLATKRDAMQILHPEMSEEDIDLKLLEITQESAMRMDRARQLVGGMRNAETQNGSQGNQSQAEDEAEKEEVAVGLQGDA